MSQEDIVEQCQVLPPFVPDRQFCIAVMKVCVLIFMVGAVAATQVPAPATTKITFFGELINLIRVFIHNVCRVIYNK